MMKKNNLKEEVIRIKSLFTEERLYGNLVEGTDEECVTQLRGKGYNVTTPTSVDAEEKACAQNERLACVAKALTDEGVGSDQFSIRKWGNGECYLLVSSTVKRGPYQSSNLSFWEDGFFNFIGTFAEKQVGPDKTIYEKFQFQGKYECNGGKITQSNFKYVALRDDKGRKHPALDFNPISGGKQVGWKMKDYFNGGAWPNPGNDTHSIIKHTILKK